jgi:primosomal protein N' (replication factor Y)
MPDRIDNRPMPVVEIVDMREEFKRQKALFSTRLVEELGARLSRRQQTILFLNRRGYAQFILCRDCGYVARCPHCAVSLAFHAAWGALKCHHCGHNRRAPVVCPECKGERIRGFGIGTERVEEEVLKLFPDARVARMDRDTTSRKGTHQSILDRFRRGDADVLIGTQMVAKGLDFPNVTLVGVVSADTSINMPDFRAAERTFQLLTQVAGRAGRGAHPGDVIVQTFTPDHYAVQAAISQDYPAFYDQEIRFRQELLYPPFRRFANIVSADEQSADARGRAEAMAGALRRVVPKDVEVLGPAPAPLSKLKSLYRWHVEVRVPSDAPLSAYLRKALSLLSASERAGLTVDVDAFNTA